MLQPDLYLEPKWLRCLWRQALNNGRRKINGGAREGVWLVVFVLCGVVVGAGQKSNFKKFVLSVFDWVFELSTFVDRCVVIVSRRKVYRAFLFFCVRLFFFSLSFWGRGGFDVPPVRHKK